uniref:Uncharacterized protein n=1 Tax=viral metagenome TaxID=1070528 RepID=A0A6C0E6I4_9ZZZZ
MLHNLTQKDIVTCIRRSCAKDDVSNLAILALTYLGDGNHMYFDELSGPIDELPDPEQRIIFFSCGPNPDAPDEPDAPEEAKDKS